MGKGITVRMAPSFDLAAFEKRMRTAIDREIVRALKNPRDAARPRLIRTLLRQGIEFVREDLDTIVRSFCPPGARSIEGITDADERDRALAMSKWIARAKAASR